MRVIRDPRGMPMSLETYRRMRSDQLRHEHESGADADAVFTGFCYGVLACGVVWLILSGIPAHLLARLAAYLGGGS